VRWHDVRQHTILVERSVAWAAQADQDRPAAHRPPARPARRHARVVARGVAAVEPHRPRISRSRRLALGQGTDLQLAQVRVRRGGRRSRCARARPYDLRHSFISLPIAQAATVVEVARQAGHAPTMALSTYAHLFDKFAEAPRTSAEEVIRAARAAANTQDVSVLVDLNVPRATKLLQIPYGRSRTRTWDLFLIREALGSVGEGRMWAFAGGTGVSVPRWRSLWIELWELRLPSGFQDRGGPKKVIPPPGHVAIRGPESRRAIGPGRPRATRGPPGERQPPRAMLPGTAAPQLASWTPPPDTDLAPPPRSRAPSLTPEPGLPADPLVRRGAGFPRRRLLRRVPPQDAFCQLWPTLLRQPQRPPASAYSAAARQRGVRLSVASGQFLEISPTVAQLLLAR
jgi:hypothetical protein